MELLTVQEYAEAAGISLAAAYKRTKGSLKDRITKVENKTFIDVAGLEFIQPVESKGETEVEKAAEKPEENSEAEDFQRIIHEKESRISELKSIASGKDEVIAVLKDQIETLKIQISSQQGQIDQLSELLKQEQQLHMSTQIVAVQNQKQRFWHRLFKKRG